MRGAAAPPLDRKSAPDFAARARQQVSAKFMIADESVVTVNLSHLSLNELTETITRHSDQPYSAEKN